MNISCHVVFDETHFPYSLKYNPFPFSKTVSTQSVLHSNPLTVIPSNLPNECTNTSVSSSNVHDSRYTTPLSSPINFAYHIQPIVNDHTMITRVKAGFFKSKLFVATATTPVIPKAVKEAIQHPNWFTAMKDEYNALIANDTWTLTTLPSEIKPIGCKWVFKNKYNADGTFQRHKARLIAKGFNQQQGLDYSETFSPVIKPTTIRIILTLTLSNNWSVHQIDINNVFLYGDL